MQACTTDSRSRGIGRYAENLVDAMVAAAASRQGIESLIAFDGIDPQRLSEARLRFRSLGIRTPTVAYTYPASAFTDIEPERATAAARIKGRFFESLSQDVHLQFSYFETWFNYTTGIDWLSTGTTRKAAIAYDLIPLIFPERYLTDPFIAEWYPKRCESYRHLDLHLAISQSTRDDLMRYLDIPAEKIRVIGTGLDPGLLAASRLSPPHDKRLLRNLGITDPFVLVVANGDWRKNALGALEIFAKLPDSIRNHHQLVLTNVGDDVRAALSGPMRRLASRVVMLARVQDEVLAELYRRCSVFFFPSLYEGFGLPVLEAMAFGAAVLSSDRGALPEVLHDRRCLFDPEDQDAAAELLGRALDDRSFSDGLRNGAAEHARTFTWDKCANQALDALEALAGHDPQPAEVKRGSLKIEPGDVDAWASFIRSASPDDLPLLERDLRTAGAAGARRILVDITCIAEFDPRSGIQRVVRNFCNGLHKQAESGEFEVQPIYWSAEGGIRYANEFSRDMLGLVQPGEDLPVQAHANDLLFMLDSAWAAPERFEPLYESVRNAGGEVVWMVYDLIPVLLPQTCHEGMPPAFSYWLEHSARHSDGFICISEATRDDLERYLDQQALARRPWTRSVGLGSDLDPGRVGAVTQNMHRLVGETLQGIPFLAVVGTLEPRKDHTTILDAFDRLWKEGQEVALVLVGKPGWNVDSVADRIGSHPENNKRLFWLKNASDGDLAHLLQHASALIQASLYEGFGLPVVEAGSKEVPLLVSDIAAVREVAGDAAEYFPVGDARALQALVANGLEHGFRRPLQGEIRARTWQEVSADLVQRLLA
jgi:glycosyltransferase involved in cell wall biosynthesis